MDEVQRNKDYKLIDLIKFLCAYLVIGIHTRPLQAVSVLLDKVVYYNISNYAVPFFYACTGYFLIVKQPEKDLHTKLGYRIKKIFNILENFFDEQMLMSKLRNEIQLFEELIISNDEKIQLEAAKIIKIIECAS